MRRLGHTGNGGAEPLSWGWCADPQNRNSRKPPLPVLHQRDREEVLFPKPGAHGHLMGAGVTSKERVLGRHALASVSLQQSSLLGPPGG